MRKRSSPGCGERRGVGAADGNPTLVTTRQRNHDQTSTGALGTQSSGILSRVSYVAMYYDAANRKTADVDVGTNGGSSYTRPSTESSRSDTVLVTDRGYSSAGWENSTTDPKGIVTQTTYDNLGRVTKTVEDYTNGTPTSSSDKTTEYSYDPSGKVKTLQVDLPSSAIQQTQWNYGVTGAIYSNDMVASVDHPDPSTGSASTGPEDQQTVNALGAPVTKTDRNGNVHTYASDVLGRLTSDAVTTLGSGVDGSVRRIETAYDGQGNAYLITNDDAASGGDDPGRRPTSHIGPGIRSEPGAPPRALPPAPR